MAIIQYSFSSVLNSVAVVIWPCQLWTDNTFFLAPPRVRWWPSLMSLKTVRRGDHSASSIRYSFASLGTLQI